MTTNTIRTRAEDYALLAQAREGDLVNAYLEGATAQLSADVELVEKLLTESEEVEPCVLVTQEQGIREVLTALRAQQEE